MSENAETKTDEAAKVEDVKSESNSENQNNDTERAADKIGDDEALGENGLKALRSERAAKAEAEKRLNEALEKIQAFEERDLSEKDKQAKELERLRKQLEDEKSAKAALELNSLRREVALEKGIPSSLVDRLKGTTLEELQADADQLLQVIAPPNGEDSRRLKVDTSLGRKESEQGVTKNAKFAQAFEAAFERASN